MMIASWMKKDSSSSQVVSPRLSRFPFPAFDTVNEFAGAIRRVMPRSAIGRSRTALKGGEH